MLTNIDWLRLDYYVIYVFCHVTFDFWEVGDHMIALEALD